MKEIQENMDRVQNSAQENLAYVRRVMEETRSLALDLSYYFILFGALVVFGTALSYLLVTLSRWTFIPWMWVIVMGAGMIVAMIRSRRIGRQVNSLIRRFLVATWLMVLVMVAVLCLSFGLIGVLSLSIALAITSASIGMGYAISAVLARSFALGLLSLPWWIGGILIPLAGDWYGPAILGGLTLFFELIPGIVMKWRSIDVSSRR